MKIGFLFDDSLDAPDGVQQYILTLGSWLRTQGHEVHYIVGQTRRRDLSNVHSISKNIAVRFNKNRLSIPLPASKRKIKKLLDTEQFDVLHVQLPFSPQFAAKVITTAPPTTAIIGTFHILPFGRLQNIGTRLLQKITMPSLKKIDECAAVSPAAQAFAKQAMHLETTVIPNAVNLGFFEKHQVIHRSKLHKHNDKKSGKVTLVFLGRLVERKGCRQFLKAVTKLYFDHNIKNIEVVIGGSGPQSEMLKKYVVQNKLTPVVRFLGQLSEAEKSALLSSADIVVLPSLAGESFGIVVVEAIAAGAGLTIGGDNPGYRFVLGATPETLVNPRNTDTFAQALRTFILDPTERQRLRKLQRAFIQQFDCHVVGAQIEALYIRAHAKHNNHKT